MKINIDAQYAMLLCLYLQRSGRAQLPDIAEELKLSLSFLQQIARKLTEAKILTSHRGRSGGYELTGDPNIRSIFSVFMDFEIVPGANKWTGQHVEIRAFGGYIMSLRKALTPVLNRTISSVNKELIFNEVTAREKVSPSGAVQ